MKKNFFKKLSFVLALAMIVSVVAPAAGAFAATAPKLNSKSKYLHLDKDGLNDFNFNVSNKGTGWTYTWTSEDEKVATVEDNGVVTATGKGTTEISVYIEDKDGEEKATLTATVTVRDNITKLTGIYLQGANQPAVDKLVVGVDYDFGRKFETFSGSTTKTSGVTRWAVEPATATISDSGKFVATAAGDYKITARSFQSSAKYKEWLLDNTLDYVTATTDLTVKVNAKMETPKQIDLDTVEVTFTAPTLDVAKNLTLYTLVGTTEVKVTTIKEVKMNAANTVATVTLFVPFVEEATYVVKHPNMDAVQFVAADTDAEDVVGLVINTKEAVLNTATTVDVDLLDKNGVDITTTGLLARVDFASSSNKTFMTGSTLYIFNKGDETTITATFHGQKWDTTGKEIGNLTATGNVVGVDAASTTVGAIKAFTIVDIAAVPSFTDVKTKLAVGDSKRLYVQLNTTTAGVAGDVKSNVVPADFKFESSDNTTLFVDNSGYLYPVKAGTVTVVVKYKDKSVDVVAVTVNGERKASTMELGATSVGLSNSLPVNDSAEVSVKVKDQLGDDLTAVVPGVTVLAGSPASNIAVAQSGKVVFYGLDQTTHASATVGTYTFKITANGLDRYVTVVITAPTSVTPSVYQLVINPTDADSKFVGSTTLVSARPNVTIDIFGYAGTKTSKPAISGAGFKVEVTNPDNVTTVLATNQYALTVASGSAITKVVNGTYKVTASEQRTVAGNLVWVAVDVDFFTVKDGQLKAVLAEVVTTISTASNLDLVARACFKVTFDGVIKTDEITMGDYVGNPLGTQIFVKNVKWTETIVDAGTTYTLVHTIDVNSYITKAAN